MPTKDTSKQDRYRVLADISYPKSREVIDRLKAGEDVPMDERGLVHRAAGKIVTDIPAESLPWLLDQKIIELVEEAE